MRCTAVALLLFCTACSMDDPSATADLSPRTSPKAVRELYLQTCHSCHESGVGGAPRTGDSAAWAPRLEKGMDTLVDNAVNGYRAMPPRGLCFDCSEAEFAALIRYMAETKPTLK